MRSEPPLVQYVRAEFPGIRFAGLFEAARLLLEEGASEDRVFPTLIYAGLEARDGRVRLSALRETLAEASGGPKKPQGVMEGAEEGLVAALAFMQNCKTLDFRFRALLTEGGSRRLELARA